MLLYMFTQSSNRIFCNVSMWMNLEDMVLHEINQSSSVAQSCLTLCNPMDCSRPRFPVHHQFPEFTQTHVHWVGDAIQPSPPLSSPSPPAFNLSQHQGLFKWDSSLCQLAKVLEFQLQHQSFQWISNHTKTNIAWFYLYEVSKRVKIGNSLAVQWLGLSAFTAVGLGFNSWSGN